MSRLIEVNTCLSTIVSIDLSVDDSGINGEDGNVRKAIKVLLNATWTSDRLDVPVLSVLSMGRIPGIICLLPGQVRCIYSRNKYWGGSNKAAPP